MRVRKFIIYQSPDDYPLQFVLRRWTVTPKGDVPDPNPVKVHRSLDVVRGHVPYGASPKGPTDYDKENSPRIIEVWIYHDFE